MKSYTQLFLNSCIVDNLTFIKIYVAFIQILILISLSTCRGNEISRNADLLCISKMKRPVLKRSTVFIVTSEKTYKLKKGRKLRKTVVMLIRFWCTSQVSVPQGAKQPRGGNTSQFVEKSAAWEATSQVQFLVYSALWFHQLWCLSGQKPQGFLVFFY